MKNFKISVTEDYDKLVPFFIENDLEFTEEDAIQVPTDLECLWEAVDENGRLIGGFVLAKRQGEFIVDGIAVDSEYRKEKLGSALLKGGIEEAAKRGGRRIYLVARAPEFFRKHGFVTVSREEAPNFFECLTCPQYGVDCHPEVMRLDLNDGDAE